MKYTIHISTIAQVKEFVRIASTLDVDVELRSDRYIVDGKSIMGVFSLNLSKDLEMVIVPVNGKDLNDETIQKCESAFKEFIV